MSVLFTIARNGIHALLCQGYERISYILTFPAAHLNNNISFEATQRREDIGI